MDTWGKLRERIKYREFMQVQQLAFFNDAANKQPDPIYMEEFELEKFRRNNMPA